MKVTSEKGGGRLARLEGILQELTRCEESKRQQSVESAAAATKQKLLSDQLLHAQGELAAAQASKTKLCEEVGALKQTKEHQARQLSKYKLDLQASRELHAAMNKKIEKLQESTRTTKQQYIKSLASRVKTSALVLQQLTASSGSSFSFELTERCSEWKSNNPNKRKRVAASEDGEHGAREEGSKSKHTGSAAESELRPSEAQAIAIAGTVDAAETQNAAAQVEQHKTLASRQMHEQQTEDRAQSGRAIQDLQAHVAQLESEYSALNDKYKALDRDHNELLAGAKSTALDIKAKDSKIEELMQMLEISRSKQPENPATSDEDKSAMETRFKLLEDNLAQMNGYADQLEMVIAQCPACTIKLQHESTQDSVVNRAE